MLLNTYHIEIFSIICIHGCSSFIDLINKFGKKDKMRGLPYIFFLFRNEFNKFNNTRARMLDSFYDIKNKLKSSFWRKNVIIMSFCTQRLCCYGRHNLSCKSVNH